MQTQLAIDLRTTVTPSAHLVSSDLGGEVVILDTRAGVYFGLADTGALIWNMLQKKATLVEIRDEILRQYRVDAARAEEDLLHLVNEMAGNGLLEVSDASAQ